MRYRYDIVRRRCLTGLLAAVTFSSAGLLFVNRRRGMSSMLSPAHSALLALLESPADAYAIGHAYLRKVPRDERSSDYLVRKIFEDLPPAKRAQRSLRTIGPLLDERMRQDFAEGDVVTVDRWILSVTEARLYALAALT